MAKAPRPGASRRAAETADAQKVATISYRGEDHTLAIGLVPLREKLAFLRATGYAFEELTFRESIYIESIGPLVWLSRRANGEPSLSFDEFCASWPNDLTIGEVTLTVEFPDDGASDPEA